MKATGQYLTMAVLVFQYFSSVLFLSALASERIKLRDGWTLKRRKRVPNYQIMDNVDRKAR